MATQSLLVCHPASSIFTRRWRYSYVFLDLDGGQRLSYFTFHPDESYEDPVLHVRLHKCLSGCHLGDYDATPFHASCFEFQYRLHPVTPNLLASTAYSFDPSSCEHERRFNLIQRRLASKLPQALPVRLPTEILDMIAKLLVRECAAVTAQQQALQDSIPSEFLVDLTRNVYAQYSVVDGVCYIKSLRNTKSETDKKEVLFLRAQEKGAIPKVFIAQDHLGIRSVHFAPSSRRPELGPGVWWKCISKRDGIGKIRVTTDTTKLRDIKDPDVVAAPEAQILWAASEHPTHVINLGTLSRPTTCPNELRMSYFECNAPGTTGYSVATDGISIATIHAHRQGDDWLGFYRDVDSSFQWIFMPLDDAEYLTEICRRYGLYVGMDAFGLVVIYTIFPFWRWRANGLCSSLQAEDAMPCSGAILQSPKVSRGSLRLNRQGPVSGSTLGTQYQNGS
ncbi:hypothetical protein CONLIGDRAFT_453683 [Coniochaeta ligniaria NRRL 30616]|uniref:Uncharacterized protein n=1 Tax=Coniochaeta ligniaria NRRL 30616 TaxID=1408157 RepID=A0A1J7JJR7_9PEZI|nr:hypothetical protein CONLIGDRAFT_453683 [Coniochaeta ligniaria NRRL 30616]